MWIWRASIHEFLDIPWQVPVSSVDYIEGRQVGSLDQLKPAS